MGLHEAGQDPHLRLHVVSVDADGRAALVGHEVGELALVLRVVLDDAEALHHVCAQHRPEFVRGVDPVHAQGVDQGDGLAVDAGLGELLQHNGDDDVIGHGPGDVREDDGHGIARHDQLLQRRTAVGPAQGLADGADGVG